MLVARIFTGIHRIIRLTIFIIFIYLLYRSLARYMSEPILTRVRYYDMTFPNLTICPSNIDTFSVDNDTLDSWMWATGDIRSRELADRAYSPLTKNMTFCVGGAGRQRFKCSSGAAGLGQWKKTIIPPGLVCETLIVASEIRNSLKLQINLDGRWLKPNNKSYLILHAGEYMALQPSQNINTMPMIYAKSGYKMEASLTLREFRRVNTHRLPCNADPKYTDEECLNECRWHDASIQEGCRGSWQKTTNLPVCTSKKDIINLHGGFIAIAKNKCKQCIRQCLYREYFIVNRLDPVAIANSTNASIFLHLSDYNFQVQEFNGYVSEDCMTDIGSNIGLLLGLSAATIISMVQRSLTNVMNRFKRSVQAQAVAEETLEQISQIDRPRASSFTSNTSINSVNTTISQRRRSNSDFPLTEQSASATRRSIGEPLDQ